jgi:Trk K+ transport system NAD-binding subunit
VGIVAGTNDDIANLSIAMTARQLKPELFMVLRQNRHANAALFQRFNANATMQPSSIVAHEFLSLLTTPLLSRFFSLALNQGDAWADVTLSRIAAVVGDTVPEVWDRELSQAKTLAIWQTLREGTTVRLGDLLRNPSNREDKLACIPLLLKRGREEILVPDNDTPLLDGDRILFCGEAHTRRQQALGLHDYDMLNYLLTGNQAPGGLVWRWLAKHGKS